jgi:hypothetical protein
MDIHALRRPPMKAGADAPYAVAPMAHGGATGYRTGLGASG